MPFDPTTAGNVPPFSSGPFPLHQLLGIEVLSAESGSSRLRMQVADRHLRDGRIVHGGVLATLLDAAVGFAARSLVIAGPDLVTVQMSVNFLRTTGPGEVLFATAEVQHPGRRSVVARGEVRTEKGRLVALGTGTLLYLTPASEAPGTAAS